MYNDDRKGGRCLGKQRLIPELFRALPEERLASVAAIAHETGAPAIHAIS
ncbi:PNPOx family protein [Bacillus xiapuensis]|nr:hypothetical protein [Bacillus xiapuensis]